MMSYRDRTYCQDTTCKNFNQCDQALTDVVKQNAIKWWGSEDAPISIHAERLGCYEG